MIKNKVIYTAVLLSGMLAFALQNGATAQGQSSWSQCTDGRAITRCETYDCPNGDTNRDGRCSLADTNARLTDSRNDSFCAAPISGCGQIHYYPSGATQSCLVQVEERSANCDLYAVATPQFTPAPTPTPTATPARVGSGTSTPTPRPTATPSPSASPSAGTTKGGEELPKTGSEHLFAAFAIFALGMGGIFLYEKYRAV